MQVFCYLPNCVVLREHAVYGFSPSVMAEVSFTDHSLDFLNVLEALEKNMYLWQSVTGFFIYPLSSLLIVLFK